MSATGWHAWPGSVSQKRRQVVDDRLSCPGDFRCKTVPSAQALPLENVEGLAPRPSRCERGGPGPAKEPSRGTVGARSVMRALVVDPIARDASDGDLVTRCLAGDDAAWHSLIGRYAGLVEAVIRRYHLSADEQADVFQDV